MNTIPNTYSHPIFKGNNRIVIDMPGIPTIDEERIMAHNLVSLLCTSHLGALSIKRTFEIFRIGNCGLVVNNNLLLSLTVASNDRKNIRDRLEKAKIVTSAHVLVLFPLESTSPRHTKKEFLEMCAQIAKDHYAEYPAHQFIINAIEAILDSGSI